MNAPDPKRGAGDRAAEELVLLGAAHMAYGRALVAAAQAISPGLRVVAVPPAADPRALRGGAG